MSEGVNVQSPVGKIRSLMITSTHCHLKFKNICLGKLISTKWLFISSLNISKVTSLSKWRYASFAPEAFIISTVSEVITNLSNVKLRWLRLWWQSNICWRSSFLKSRSSGYMILSKFEQALTNFKTGFGLPYFSAFFITICFRLSLEKSSLISGKSSTVTILE